MSPILGDVLVNSRWWLRSHRRNLHSNVDHHQQANSSVLLDYVSQLHTSRTAAVPSRRVTCLLLHTAGGSLRQNLGKIGLLIQAVRKVIPAPTRFWDRGARWFVVRLYVLEQAGDELHRFSEYICCLFEARPVFNTLCREKFLPSRVARGYMSRKNGGHVVDDGSTMSGANGCRGASSSKLTATPRSMGANWSWMDSLSPGHRRPIFPQLQELWYCPDFNL